MHGTLTRKFVDLMAEYQELQSKYKGKYREKVCASAELRGPMDTYARVSRIVAVSLTACLPARVRAGRAAIPHCQAACDQGGDR